MQAPSVAAAICDIPKLCAIIRANTTKNADTIAVIPEARPSRPSVKFTAFTVPIITISIRGI